MTTIILLYVVDSTVKSKDVLEPSFPLSMKHPLLWIGTTTSINTNSVIYDKRSTYIKCKNQKRYYSEYMELFKYIDRHESLCSPYTVSLLTLETGVTKELVQDRLMHYLHIYRVYHGDRLVLSPEYRRLIETQIKLFNERVPVPFTPSADERRERLNAKSKRYYSRNKELIKARRDQKKLGALPDAVIENTAQ